MIARDTEPVRGSRKSKNRELSYLQDGGCLHEADLEDTFFWVRCSLLIAFLGWGVVASTKVSNDSHFTFVTVT